MKNKIQKTKEILLIIVLIMMSLLFELLFRKVNKINKCEPPAEIENKAEICADAEDFGYANGLVMAGRVLGEQKFLNSQGWQGGNKTCEQVVDELYNQGHPVASGEYKFNRDYNL